MHHFAPARRLVVLLSIAFAISLSVPSTALAVKTLALSSGSFAFEIAPAETGSGEVVVINDGDEDIKVLVYVADVQIDEAGEQTYVLPERQGAAMMSSPATWMRVYMPEDSKAVGNTPYLELKPGQRVPVKFDFSPPRNATPGDHNVIMFFEMFDFLPESAGSVSQVSGRIGARIQLRVTGEYVENVEIRPFEVPAFQIGTAVPYKFTINNTGNVNQRLTGMISLLDRNQAEVIASDIASDTPVYAGSSLEVSGEVTSVASVLGPHTVEVRLQYLEQGATSPTEVVATRTVWMIPMWFILVLGGLVLALVAWLVVRASRKRGPESLAPEAEPVEAPVHARGPVPADGFRYDSERDTIVSATPTCAPAPRPVVAPDSATKSPWLSGAPSAEPGPTPDTEPGAATPDHDTLQLDFGPDE